MQIVDSQIHIWEDARMSPQHRHIPTYSMDDALKEMAEAGGGAAAKDDAAYADLGEMLAVAKYPNVALKLSGAPSYSSEPYPYRNIHKYIRQMFDAFGPQRCFWGTDITRMPCSYRQCVTMFTEELPWLRGRDKELVMGQAVCDWIGWKHPALAT